METDNKNKEKETLENKLNDFLTDNNQNNQECEGE